MDEDDILVGPTPLSLSQDELEAFVRELGGPNEAIPTLAREISNILEEEQPEYFRGGYESLKNGTATVFDITEGTAELSPKQRGLSDENIIRTFLTNPDGSPIREGSFMEGFKREAPKQVGAFGGFIAGAKAGAAATAGIPPVSPPTILAKAGVPLVTGVIGAIGGQNAVDYFQEKLLGEEDLILPGTTPEEEMGKTAATVAGFFATPWAISKNVNFGAAQYLDNLAQMNADVAPMAAKAYRGDQAAMEALTSPAMQEALRTGGRGSRSIRFTRGAERMLSKTAEEARKNPVLTALAETGAGVGATTAAGVAEESAPGEALPRVAAEAVGGIVPSIFVPAIARGVSTLYSNRDQLKPFFRDIKERFDRGGLQGLFSGVKEQRLQKATDRIRVLLESQEEDVDSIIEALEATGRALVDETGKPLPITSGAKAGSPTLLAIESALEAMAPRLGEERAAAAESAINAIRAQVMLMSQSGNREALEASASTLNDVFTSALTNRLSSRNEKLLEAFEAVAGADQRSNAELGQALYDIAEKELAKARAEESRLWGEIPAYTIDLFGAEEPAFITFWKEATNFDSPEAESFVTGPLAPLAAFVKRKLGEINNFETMVDAGLSSKELVEMRSVANTLRRQLLASGDTNGARISGNFAKALLEDLERIPDSDLSLRYMAAREYSKALNDVYTRAFTSDILSTERSGAQQLPVELLMKQMLQGGADPTLLRIRDLQKVAQFSADKGLEGAEQTMANIDTVYEAMLRSARATALDPTSAGKINQQALNRWMTQNAELLDMFPALRSDLQNLDTAQVLLNRTAAYNKAKQAKIQRQVNFQNLLGENAESPVFAVAQALSTGNRFPLRSLDNLTRVAMNAPEEAQAGAKKALQGAILEWVMTKGGSTGTRFSPKVMWETLTDPIRGSGTDGVSLISYMKAKDLITDAEARNLDSMLREMIKYEAGMNAGTIDQLAEDSGPIFDLFLRISGAKLGTMGSEMLGGGSQSLIAAGAGSKAMRQVFENIPLALQMDVMLDLVRDPKLLAMYLKKPASEKEKMGLVNKVVDYFKKKGLDVVRRGGAAAIRETEEDLQDLSAEPVIEEPAAPVQTPTPVTSEPLVQLPPLQMPAPQPAAPVPNPQMRQQYAALFPNDPTSEMIRGGIGSLG